MYCKFNSVSDDLSRNYYLLKIFEIPDEHIVKTTKTKNKAARIGH